MKISQNWLKTLVDINSTPEELSEKLSIGGFEVDDLEDCSTNVDGVVCSPNELDKLKDFNKLKVVPGIRNDISNDDQKRVMSPVEAYKKGADFIVVGRPITKSEDPRKALELFL